MPGELELDTASCIMVHRRTPRLLTQSVSWIRCYRLPYVLFDLSNKPWSLSVTSSSYSSSRPPTLSYLSIGSRNPKIGFYVVVWQVLQRQSIIPRNLRERRTPIRNILITRPIGTLITRLIPALMTTAEVIDIQPRKGYPSPQHVSLSCCLCFYRVFSFMSSL